MQTVALSGNDTIKLNNRVFNDLADGDAVMLEYEGDIATVKTGKNKNSLFAANETGRQGTITVRLVRGSADDKFMNNLLAQQLNNFAGFVLMQGEFVKRIGNGLGGVTDDTYIVAGAVFSKAIPAKDNAEGDVEQTVSVYVLKAANVVRVIT